MKTIKLITCQEWDQLVKNTYGRVYDFQQQNGCKGRGMYELTVPDDDPNDYSATTIPEIVNGPEMGVSLAAWLARDPEQPLTNQEYSYQLSLWWERNFYPHVSMVANDLHAKDLLEAGEYVIVIDW